MNESILLHCCFDVSAFPPFVPSTFIEYGSQTSSQPLPGMIKMVIVVGARY